MEALDELGMAVLRSKAAISNWYTFIEEVQKERRNTSLNVFRDQAIHFDKLSTQAQELAESLDELTGKSMNLVNKVMIEDGGS